MSNILTKQGGDSIGEAWTATAARCRRREPAGVKSRRRKCCCSNRVTTQTSPASLREPVDTFFDEIMVMADDEAVRNKRLALLNRLVPVPAGSRHLPAANRRLKGGCSYTDKFPPDGV